MPPCRPSQQVGHVTMKARIANHDAINVAKHDIQTDVDSTPNSDEPTAKTWQPHLQTYSTIDGIRVTQRRHHHANIVRLRFNNHGNMMRNSTKPIWHHSTVSVIERVWHTYTKTVATRCDEQLSLIFQTCAKMRSTKTWNAANMMPTPRHNNLIKFRLHAANLIPNEW